MKLKFTFEKETKGAVRYQEVDPATGKLAFAPKIGTLYVKKSSLPEGKIAQTVEMEIEFK